MHLDISKKSSLEGKVERIIYYKEDTGYCVFNFQTKNEAHKCVGIIPEIKVGEYLKLEGECKTNRYGMQIEVSSIQRMIPTTNDGIIEFLSSHLPNIGRKRAENIVKVFGEKTFNIIENEPEKLLKIKGLTQERINEIVKSYKDYRVFMDIYVFLYSIGLKPSFAQKIYSKYGENTINTVKENPYILTNVEGIGFLTADKIALNMGYSETGEYRLHAAIYYALKDAENSGGHCFLESNDLSSKVISLLKLKEDDANELVKQQIKNSDSIIVINHDIYEFVYRRATYEQEQQVAQDIKRIVDNASAIEIEQKTIELTGIEFGLRLSEQQNSAISLSLRSGVSVITGGPGTGKTTLVRALIACVERASDKTTILCSPTGRAAKRLAQATGRDASTIHRLLFNVWRGEEITKEKATTLPANAIYIIDESSMIDLNLMHALMHNIPDGAQVVFIGDIDQLPSVGKGDVLRSLIRSKKISVTKLNSVFRQDEQSYIVKNAHLINKGELPKRPEKTDDNISDFYLFSCENSSKKDFVKIQIHLDNLLQNGYNQHDIQILCPQRKGDLGVINLNKFLQNRFNPFGQRIFEEQNFIIDECELRVGDRVMHIKNNYNLNVFNGDVGEITGYNSEEKYIVVSYDEQKVVYDEDVIQELRLAYASTVHKSQGSEYPAVIILLAKQHSIMRQRNLLYTALTRAKKTAAIFTDYDSIAYAVANNTPANRNSMLAENIYSIL